MLSRATTRQRPATLRRKVAGLLAIVWLNMAVLPCAMAFPSDKDCPHCPPAEHHDMASHHGHGETSAKPSCVTAEHDCCDVVAASRDARDGKPERTKTPEVVFAGTLVAARAAAISPQYRHCALDPPHIAGSATPLHVLFCVYLD